MKRYRRTVIPGVILLFLVLSLVAFGVVFYWWVASFLDRAATTMFFIGWFSAIATTGLGRAAMSKQ